MKNRRIFFAAVIGGVALLLIGIWIGRSTSREAVFVEASEGVLHRSESVWTCSMHPQIRQPEPGDCPICGMDLIPAASDSLDEGDLPKLVLSERAVALLDVQTWPVERKAIEREVRLAGKIGFDERRVGTISARFPGRLEQLHVNFTGTYVEEGEPMAEIYSPVLISAQEELLQVLRMQQVDELLLGAARDRLRLLGLTDEQIGEIEKNGMVIDRLTIFSPMSGIVTERLVSSGSYIETGQAIYQIVDLAELWVNLEAYESDLIWLDVGQKVTVATKARPGESLDGTIAFIDPFLKESSRTTNLRVDLEEPVEWLKPGMFVRGSVFSVLGNEEEIPLVIPATAPLITGERAIVYVKSLATEGPVFEAREILLGPKTRTHYVVIDGLEEGENVVTRGHFQIDSELQIRGRPSMMAPAEPSQQVVEPIHEVAVEVAVDLVPAAFGQQIDRLAQAYLDLAEALAADDLVASQGALEEMRRRLGKIDSGLLGDEAILVWIDLERELQSLLSELFEGASLSAIRDFLQPLTVAVETALLSFHAGQVGSVYKAYCPMALDDRGGIWLQRDDSIVNAYFGSIMHRCGDILGKLSFDQAAVSDDSRL